MSSNVSRGTRPGMSFLQGYLIQVACSALLFDVAVVSGNPLSCLIMHCTVPYRVYTLHLTTEGRGEKVGCVAASALHSVPILHFLVASGVLHCLYCSIL